MEIVNHKHDWTEINLRKLNIQEPINLTLVGQSIAGCRSCICIPEFGVAFDYGFNSIIGFSQPMVAVTHGHADHMGCLHLHSFERRMQRMSTPTYLMPSKCYDNFKLAYEAYKKLNRHGQMLLQHVYNLESAPQKTPKGNYIIKSYQTDHTVPSQGYVVFDARKKLKPEYQGLDGKEIARLIKEEKIEVSDRIEVPIFGYTGDTRIEGILNNPDFLNCRVLVTECSFIGLDEQDNVEKCRKRGHIHLDELERNISSFKNGVLILTHFSRRYTKEQIIEKVKTFNDSTNLQVIPFI